MIHMLYTDDQGNLYDHPRLAACGRSGAFINPLTDGDVIPLPEGATLTALPGQTALGWDPRKGGVPVEAALVERGRGAVMPVGALLPQGFTRLSLPGYDKPKGGPMLPLFGYTAAGMKDGEVVVAARQTDEHRRWHPAFYNAPDLDERIQSRLAVDPENRILRQLARCSTEYRCFTAQNIFYRRWEGGLPVSPACNAGCIGCISLQESECCASPQGRIDFRPNPEEAAAVATHHLEGAEDGIISFGQGCEGEPSLEAVLIEGIIRETRRKTGRGTINMNSNAGYLEGIRRIAAAGLDSIRVSLISAVQDDYEAYYRPRGYSLPEVAASVDACRGNGVFVSLNLLALPGYTDRPDQVAALEEFIKAHPVHMVQLRNLNIDPDLLPSRFQEGSRGIGMGAFIERLRETLGPDGIGNYTRSVAFSETGMV